MSDVFLTREEIEHPYANLAVMLEDKRKKAEQMRRTVFAKITASPEVLAMSLCGNVRVGCFSGYYSMLTGRHYPDMEEAIAATLEKLKKVAE